MRYVSSQRNGREWHSDREKVSEPVAVIDPSGLFGGDRLRRCSNLAQLHWPRLFLASDGFGRLELNYANLLRAYATFSPIPTEAELEGYLEEYAKNFLLFVFQIDDQVWGQWDTKSELLPRYKTASDRRSPAPPDSAIAEWKRRYREQSKSLPKSFGKLSEKFLHGVGVGVGEGIGVGVGEEPSASPESEAPKKQASPEPATASPKAGSATTIGTRFELQELPGTWREFAVGELEWDPSRAEQVFATFGDYWRGKPGKDGRKSDWLATWRNWCRRESTSRNPGVVTQPQSRYVDRHQVRRNEGLAMAQMLRGVKP